ncbi:hypothetical protein ENKNEFLB_01400 [Nocardioides aquaticus]|uniref:DUF3987 domain-containing protein n=2 Tax=Nocardioides aquaticus TaxID=160826 RepID=A0ABX8EEU2_9ACTN|nr:hypothetical protein ENKNEFLB_01400 [Nocardioides aquaticus]
MAVCAVMGHLVDGLDVDAHKGGDLSALGTPPTPYGRQRTPSGGTHDLVASLGVPSRDGVLPGVDVKAGVDGGGHGFLFLAPTEKLSKATGEVVAYRWEVAPYLADLAVLGGDDTGAALAALVRAPRARADAGALEAYDGPDYADLTREQRAAADRHVEATLFDWGVRLAGAAEWPDGERDAQGRGWEGLARDWAWTVAKLAAAPWTALDEDDAEAEHDERLPGVIAADPKCRGKWRDGIVDKAAADGVPSPPWLDPVFDATPVLRHVRQAAHSRMLGSRGLLVCTLVRLAAEVPLGTALPPVVGSRAALNIGAALVGGSGGGKTAMFDVSRELLGLAGEGQRRIERVPGSGEGLIETYLEGRAQDDGAGGKTRPVVADPRRLFYVDEIGQLGATKDGRSGATLGPVLRSLLTGGMLGTENADAARRRHVPAGAYRAALVAGVQPVASEVLLSAYDVGAGTPQRFVWALTVDPTIPDEDVDWPGPLDWRPPAAWPAEVEYPEHLRAEIRRQARAAARGEDAAEGRVDGHARLTRLKVAALLAVLHGEAAITDRWWRLAGVVAGEWTEEAIAACRASLSSSRERQAAAEGRMRGHTRVAEEDFVAEDRQRRDAVAVKVLSRVAEAGEDGLSWADLRRDLRRSRDLVERLVGTPEDPGPLVAGGQVRLAEVTVRGKPATRLYPGEGA